jgi:peptidoglycan/LPS O-acetylase OafA/YrhL
MTCYDLSERMDPTRTGIIGGFVSEAAITYRPQLDALRTFAVFGVLGSHYWLKESLLGHFGVRLFFVLSGFLITSILLQRGSTLAFYARRAARLWPAFYLCLAFALLLDLDGYRTSWKWHAAQLTNIFLSRHGTWDLAWPAAALWSLNVEEQFYLVWPLIIAATPRKMLPVILSCIIAVGPLYRIAAGALDLNEVALVALPPASLDALGAGALMAVWPRKVVYWLGAACAPVLIFAFLPNLDGLWRLELIELGLVPVFCALVLGAYRGAFRPLQWAPLPALGRISYGIYLYHLPVLAVAMRLGVPANGPFTLIICSTMTAAIALFSYRVFERPIREVVARQLKRAELPVSDRPFESSLH